MSWPGEGAASPIACQPLPTVPAQEVSSTTIQSRIAIPDQFSSLPPRSRRGGGRTHHVFWAGLGSSSSIVEPNYDAMTFNVRSVRPQTLVTFGSRKLTFSFVSVKTGAGQQGDGPWEYLLAKHLEATPEVTTYQMHSLSASWSADGLVARTYRPDAVWADVAGQVTCGEVKASASYFAEPETRTLCDAAEKGLAAINVRFARITGDEMQEDRRRAFNVSRAFADRLTAFSPRQLAAAREATAVGEIALGRLGEVLRVHPSSALQVVNAMMTRRHLAYDLSAPITSDLPIAAAAGAAKIPDLGRISA